MSEPTDVERLREAAHWNRGDAWRWAIGMSDLASHRNALANALDRAADALEREPVYLARLRRVAAIFPYVGLCDEPTAEEIAAAREPSDG